jgi:hypothetical protein
MYRNQPKLTESLMNESTAYRLGRWYGRLSPLGKFAVLAAFGTDIVWALLPSERSPASTLVSKAPVKAEQPVYDPVAKWGEAKVTSALNVWTTIHKDSAIYEEGWHLVVEMRFFITDPSKRLEYARAIADTDVILHGKPRTIFFYDPSRKKIAQADTLNGIRLTD